MLLSRISFLVSSIFLSMSGSLYSVYYYNAYRKHLRFNCNLLQKGWERAIYLMWYLASGITCIYVIFHKTFPQTLFSIATDVANLRA